MHASFSALIPAAGNSERMGRDKALLPFAHGVTFAGHLANCYGAYGCFPVVLVVNEQFDTAAFQQEGIRTVVNRAVDRGRSWSILLGLRQVPEGNACFIQNVDNPFLEPGLLDKLLESLSPGGYAVPVYEHAGGHPILLGSEVAAFLRKKKEIIDFRRVLQSFTRIEVPYPDEQILLNVNTSRDYAAFISKTRF